MDLAENTLTRTIRLHGFLISRELIARAIVAVALVLAMLFYFEPQLARSVFQPWVELFLVLIVPGFMLSRILFPDESGFGLAEFPVALTLSLALWALPAALLRLLHSDWEHFRMIFVAVLWSLGLVYLIQATRRARNHKMATDRDLKLDLVLIALALAVGVVVARGPRDMDDWLNLGIVQQIVQQNTYTPLLEFDPRYSFRYATHVWLFLQAFLTRSTEFDPITLARDVLPALLAPLSLFAWYAWAKEFTGKRWAGLLAVCFQLLIFATFLTPAGWGRGFFARIAQDKFLVGDLMLPLALLFFWRFLSQGRAANWLAFGLCCVAMIFVHPIGVVQVGAALGGFALFNLVMRDRFPLRRWALASLWLAPGAVLALLLRFVTSAPLFSLDLQAGAYLRLSEGRLVFEPPDFYFAHPDLVAQPLVLLGLLLLPLLIPSLGKDRRAQFLWGSTLVPLALLYNPYTAWLLGQVITPWQLWRLTWILPVSLTVAYLASSMQAHRVAPTRWTALYVGLAIIAALFLGDLNLNRGFKYLATPHTLPAQTEDLLRALPRYLSQPSVILLPRPLARLAPAFSANAQLASPTAYQREDVVGRQIKRLYKNDPSLDLLLTLIKEHDVRFVVLPKNSPLDEQVRQKRAMFVERYNNREFRLYEVAQLTSMTRMRCGCRIE